MIGVKSIAVVVLAAIAFAIALARFSVDHITELTIASGFCVGLFASIGAALAGFGADATSRAALVLRPRIGLVVDLPRRDPSVRELPSVVQRALLVGVFACVGLATFTTDATARIASVPSELAEPSRAKYCLPPEAKPEQVEVVAPVAPPPPVDQAGCALVKRAFQLGYAKTLGSCAPKAAVAPRPVEPIKAAPEVCDRRELDEPFLHYTWRRVADVASDASPSDYSSKRIAEFQTRLDYLRDLLADIKHSITGTAHGSHHLFITLPDPQPKSAIHSLFTGEERCANRFADLPLWPAFTADDARSSPGKIVEHVLGQLLFATRFGTPASCSDYTLHWGAPRDICAAIAANPEVVLDEYGALAPLRAVLDRRHRQAQLRELATTVKHAATLPITPPANAVVSVSCLVVGDSAASLSGKVIVVDGEPLSLREAHLAAITVDAGPGASPLDLYAAIARLLAGTAPPGVERTTAEPLDPLTESTFPLARLEPLVAHDPFVDKAALRTDIMDVYPIDKHLHAYIQTFRRVYSAQRGRL